MTGTTPLQVGSSRGRTGFWCIPQALRAGLEILGVEVEQRPLEEGDLFSRHFDLIVLGYASPGGFNSRHSNQVTVALGQWVKSWTTAAPVAMMMDDWHVLTALSTVDSWLREPQRARRATEHLDKVGGVAWLDEHWDDFLGGLQLMHEGRWPPFILQRFNWGNPTVMLNQARTITGLQRSWSLDPSPMMPKYPFSPPDDRLEQWTCPRLQTRYDKWLDEAEKQASWPILRFGNQRLGERVVKEWQVPQVVCESLGTLAPQSMAPGSGMWRSRYQIAAATRTILVTDPSEQDGLPDVFKYTAPEVEALHPKQREALAEEQAAELEAQLWTPEQFVQSLARMVEAWTGTALPRVDDVVVPEWVAPEPEPVRAPRVRPVPPEATPAPSGAGAPAPRTPREPRAPREKQPRAPRVVDVGATEYRAMEIRPGDRVLDVGAHRGEFVAFAKNRAPDAFVVAVEADPDNYRALTEAYATRPDPDRVVFLQVALIGDEQVDLEGKVALWLAGGKDTTMHSLLPRRGRKMVPVAAEPFSRLVQQNEPTVLKIAVEGYECRLFDDLLPDSVRELAVKFHVSTDASRGTARGTIQRIEAMGFECVQPPKIDRGSWPVVGVWRRSATPDGEES